MLQRLYELFFEIKEYCLLACLVVISLILLALNDNRQVREIRSLTTVVFGSIDERLSFIPSYLGLWPENAMLRRVNMELADEAQRLREATLENYRLRQLLALKQQTSYSLLAARVVNKNLLLMRNTITIDAGSDEGVQVRMPVISDGGLVGVVAAVSRHYAVVNMLENVDCSVTAKIQRSRVDGVITWNGMTLSMKNVTKTRDVKTGDMVMTSEYSNILPPNIRIGIIGEVSDDPSSLFKIIRIAPGVDPVKLEEVFVMQVLPNQERTMLEQPVVPHPPVKSKKR